jgi:putative copper export protein
MSRNESSAGLAAAIVDEAERLVRLEIALAKQEAKELAITNAIGAGMLVGAGLLALVAVLVAVPVLIVVLVEPAWIAALIWIVLYLAVAAALAFLGKARIRIEVPPRTVNSLKETKEWALRQIRSSAR